MLHPTENTVEQRGPSNARFQAPDFASGAGALARGGEQLGKGIGDVAEAADKIGEEYDTAAVKQADAQDLTQLTQIRADVLSARGFDVQTALADARTKITQIRNTRLASLKGKRQQRMYTDVFDRRNLAMEETFANHSVSQIAEAHDNAAKDRAATYGEAAVRSFGTKEFDTNVDTALGEVATYNRGQLPEVVARQQFIAKSAILKKAIGAMAEDPDQAAHAALAIDQYAKELTPDDEHDLRKSVQPILNENRRDADVGAAFARAPFGPNAKPTDTAAPPTSATPPPPAPSSGPHPAAPVAPHMTGDKFVPVAGARITDNAAAHRARGSSLNNAVDYAAPAGTPIHAPMSGTVVKNWYDPKGGWSLVIQHPNGRVTGYAHMRTQSHLAAGAHVEPDIPIGSVGSTGDATGPHVHFTVRMSPAGAKVDPESVLWDKNSVNPHSVPWKEPDKPVPRETGGEPQQFQAQEHGDLEGALNYLHARAKAENWSDYRYNQAVDKARQVAGVQNELQNQHEEDKYSAATAVAVKLDKSFTSISQIPGFGGLKPEYQKTLQNWADANAKAAMGDQVKANGDRYLYLKLLAGDPTKRGAFLGIDLAQERPNMTGSEYVSLSTDQEKLRLQPNGELAANLGKVHYLANRYVPVKKGSPFTNEQQVQYSDRLRIAIERRQGAEKHPLLDKDYDDIARALVTTIVPAGGKAQPLFEQSHIGGQIDAAHTYQQIPPDVAQELTNQLARQGRHHSQKDVVAEWLRTRAR